MYMRNVLFLGEYDNPVQCMIGIAQKISDKFGYVANQIYHRINMRMTIMIMV